MVSGIGAATGAVLVPGDPPEPTTENNPPSDGADFVVEPDAHSPGTGTAYTLLSRGEGPWDGSEGLETIDFYKITTQETMFQGCTPDNARAFGIDRGNDGDGTKTDTSLLSHMKQYSVSGRIISVEIYDEGDLGGSPTHLNRTDETVARLADCVVTPEEPGWYQFTGYVNGTNYAGEFQEVTLYSKYFYICDCESREEAERKLGPAPHSGGTEATATPEPTTTATATPEPARTATATPAQAPGTPEATGTSTPTPSQTTATATPASARDEAATASSTATVTRAVTEASPTVTVTATAAAAAGATPTVTAPTTPTLADGPGFGPVVALVAVALAGLLARRD